MTAAERDTLQSPGSADARARQRAVLDAALDCVIGIDDRGCVTYLNPSAQGTFGLPASKAVGRELAELIVPPSQREAHRRGLARYLRTGEAAILGRRIELIGMRADGSEFPVELTVTRLDPPAGPGFLGFVRDITERVVAEEALRAAHRRIALIANEQAALRRVATLVARQASPEELFAVVAEEVAQVLGVRSAAVLRYDPDSTVTPLGVWGESSPFALGAPWPLAETVAAAVIWRTGQAATVDAADCHRGLAATLLANDLRIATGVPIIAESRLWGAMVVHESDPETLPDDVASRLESFTELLATAVANATARLELLAARRRVIEATDAARERLTRDIHDGAQRHFVNALISLQRAQQKWESDSGRARELLDLAVGETDAGVEALRELVAGIHPAVLSDLGLAAALESLGSRAPIPVSLEIDAVELPPSIAVSAYFFCSEALTNVVKHARARSASVRVGAAHGELRIEVQDDGVGGAVFSGGSGLIGLRDRIGALDGRITLSNAERAGTTLTACIPLPA